MSSVAASPPAPAARAPRRRRPSTAAVYRWELRKLVSQKRTYLGLALVVILPLFFVVFQNVHQRHDRGAENIFATQITQSGLATPVLMLLFLSVFMLPLAASLVAGDIVAAEDGNGTLKTILTRSAHRGQAVAAKALAAVTYAAIAVFLSAAVATIGGVVSWGYNQITTYSGTKVSASEGLLLVLAANAFYLIPLLTVVGVVVFTIVLLIVAQIPGLEAIKPYLLTEQYENWHGLLRTPTDWAPIWHSLWVCGLYAVPALFAAYLVFLRRDVAGG